MFARLKTKLYRENIIIQKINVWKELQLKIYGKLYFLRITEIFHKVKGFQTFGWIKPTLNVKFEQKKVGFNDAKGYYKL